MTRKRMIVCAVLLGILFVCVSAFHLMSAKEIPFLNGVRFGMSPKQAEKHLGECFEIYGEAEKGEKIARSYRTNVMGHDAYVICWFLDDKILTELSVNWSEQDTALFEQVYNCLYEYYSGHEDFFVKDTMESDELNGRVSIGIDNGATGLFYSIQTAEDGLYILCVNNF